MRVRDNLKSTIEGKQMRKSLLPVGGVNLFQGIKAKCREAEASGLKLYRLSIGQPAGPALLEARRAEYHVLARG